MLFTALGCSFASHLEGHPQIINKNLSSVLGALPCCLVCSTWVPKIKLTWNFNLKKQMYWEKIFSHYLKLFLSPVSVKSPSVPNIHIYHQEPKSLKERKQNEGSVTHKSDIYLRRTILALKKGLHSPPNGKATVALLLNIPQRFLYFQVPEKGYCRK